MIDGETLTDENLNTISNSFMALRNSTFLRGSITAQTGFGFVPGNVSIEGSNIDSALLVSKLQHRFAFDNSTLSDVILEGGEFGFSGTNTVTGTLEGAANRPPATLNLLNGSVLTGSGSIGESLGP